VPEADAPALADVLEALLRDPRTSARMAATARRVAIERHGRDLMNARYEALFLELARA
jgi:glycosyltransferase involved in cell wall biosynthesis